MLSAIFLSMCPVSYIKTKVRQFCDNALFHNRVEAVCNAHVLQLILSINALICSVSATQREPSCNKLQ